MAKVIFFDDIDFELKPDTSGDEVSTSGKWLDNGIYFTNPKSENGQPKPHHIAHDSYIYTLGSKVTPGDEYASKTGESNYYISVISGISANPFEKKITYDTTKYDLSGIFEDLSNMKQQISEILGRLNGAETVSSFTFSLSRTGITDSSLPNFVVGEPILAKITSITPPSAKYSDFNIVKPDDNSIEKITHTFSGEDSFYFNNASPTSVSATIKTGSENESVVTSTVDSVTVRYAPIYTYAYSCGVRVAGLGNININETSNFSLQNNVDSIYTKMFESLKDKPVETDSTIANKKLSDYYNVPNANSYKIYYDNSYTTTTGTSLLLAYAIKQQDIATYINTSVELNVQAYLVCYTAKTEDPNSIGDYDDGVKKYAYISKNINSATVEQYLGRDKEYYTCQNTNNKGEEITSGTTKVSVLPFTGNKPHRKDILITYTLIRPTGITVSKNGAPVESLQLTVNEPVNLVVTLNSDGELHEELKGITVAKTGGIEVSKTSIKSGETITVTTTGAGAGSGNITFSNSKITTVNNTIDVTVSDNVSVSRYIITDKLNEDGEIITTITPLDDNTTYGINLLAPGTVKTGDLENIDYKSIVSGFPLNDNTTNNYFATKQKYSIYILNLSQNLFKLGEGEGNENNNPVSYEERNGEMYYMIKSIQSASQFNGEEFYIQID